MKSYKIAASVILLSCSSALAADLPSRKAAPVVAPAPIWTGFYAGLNAGVGVGTSTGVQTQGSSTYDFASSAYDMPFGFTSPYRTGTANVAQLGIVGGGQVGYNYQINQNILAGLETDFQGSGIQGYGSSYGLGGALGNNGVTHLQYGINNTQAGLDWIGTVRGRVGYLVTPTILLFGTGGFAYGNTWANVSSYGYHWHPYTSNPPDIVFPTANSLNTVSVGWTAGGGAEWMFMQNWSAKVEAIYYSLGSQTLTGQYSPLLNERLIASPIALINAATTTVNYNGVIARAGVNYHFNLGSAPVVAKF